MSILGDKTRIKFRSATNVEWTSNNPVLAKGEPGFEWNTYRLKIGNGTDDWATLAYIGFSSSAVLAVTLTGFSPSNTAITAGDNILQAFNHTQGQINFIASDYIPLSQKAAANGVATLDGTGKVPSIQLPAIAITDTFVVGSQAAMLALTAQTGDVAVRTDENKSYILRGTNPAVLADWNELLTPTDTVLSVNGQTGAVSLSLDNISDVTAPGPSIDDILKWNGSAWINGTVPSSGIIVGSTTITGGINKKIGFNNSGVYGETTLYYSAGKFGFNETNPGAVADIVGLGNTNATKSLRVRNSDLKAALIVDDALNVYANRASSADNTFFGFEAGRDIDTGSLNTFYGYTSGQKVNTGSSLTFIGHQAGMNATSATLCVFVGSRAGENFTDQFESTYVGVSSGLNSNGRGNTLLGYSAGRNLTSAINTTAVGRNAGFTATTADGCIFLGAFAGYYETGSNKLMIANDDYGSEAAARTKAILYGELSGTTANQVLHINAGHINVDDLPVGNAGVASGELYVDDAATITGNGDKFVARKA